MSSRNTPLKLFPVIFEEKLIEYVIIVILQHIFFLVSLTVTY